MKKISLLLVLLSVMMLSCKPENKEQKNIITENTSSNLIAQPLTSEKKLVISPISHATMVLTYGSDDIFVDPTGGKEAFQNVSEPEIILITDIHGDHFDIQTLQAIDASSATIIAPKAVVDKFPSDFNCKKLITLNNGETTEIDGYAFEAIPMYNLREDALKFHEKGRGNGYVVTINDERIYISGDTEDIPEMRTLTNIDIAFVCMNLPYTMTVDKAAEAVLDFKPKKIYPYHYRGTDGLSDVEKFKTLVNQGDAAIKVVQLNWYP